MLSKTDISMRMAALQKGDAFWNVMLLQSNAQSGPFDGGCLICAKAIQQSIGGNLVRVVSDANERQTEHYGVTVNGSYVDFDGVFDTHEAWINNFKKCENVNDRRLWIEHGHDQSSSIVDDAWAVKKVSQLLLSTDNIQGE